MHRCTIYVNISNSKTLGTKKTLAERNKITKHQYQPCTSYHVRKPFHYYISQAKQDN